MRKKLASAACSLLVCAAPALLAAGMIAYWIVIGY